MNKILVTAATSFELVPLIQHLETAGIKKSFFEYELAGKAIFPLVTGIGPTFTAFAMARFTDIQNIYFAINIGIAGAYDMSTNLGEVYQIDRDKFGDLGVEEADGTFTDVFDLELMKNNNFPFVDGWIINDSKPKVTSAHPKASCLTVSRVSGTDTTAAARAQKYNAQLESMEGAAFSYACKMMQVDYMQLKAVSNHVESRNKDKWNIDLAINNVNQSVIDILSSSV